MQNIANRRLILQLIGMNLPLFFMTKFFINTSIKSNENVFCECHNWY